MHWAVELPRLSNKINKLCVFGMMIFQLVLSRANQGTLPLGCYEFEYLTVEIVFSYVTDNEYGNGN